MLLFANPIKFIKFIFYSVLPSNFSCLLVKFDLIHLKVCCQKLTFRAIEGYIHQIGFKDNLYFFFVKMENSEDKSGWYSVDINNKNILLVEEEAFSEKLLGEKYGIQVTSIYDFYKKNRKLFNPDWRRSNSGR